MDSLQHFWLPFTANRQFKERPRLLESAQGMYYRSADGRKILDSTSGLWCCNAGHCREAIVHAISAQAQRMDFAPTFQMGHSLGFTTAAKLAQLAPEPLKNVFFTNSGSESVDTAMKLSMAYRWARQEPDRNGFISREKSYHGVNLGGVSIAGIPNNAKQFSNRLTNIHFLPHTLDLERNAYSRGLPEHGLDKAEALEELLNRVGPESITAVIVEPIAGSAGVILPAEGYLARIREICTAYDVLLIFDEVITGFGRVGQAFASFEFGVTPDIITAAKGLTNGAVPMGAVFISDKIHQTLMRGPENVIEFFHGYTYSAHPLACAAALASIELYQKERLFTGAYRLGKHWEEQLHRLDSLEAVEDVRNYGLMGAVQLRNPGEVGHVGYRVFTDCFWNHNLLVRATADTIAMSPPLIVDERQIVEMIDRLEQSILSL